MFRFLKWRNHYHIIGFFSTKWKFMFRNHFMINVFPYYPNLANMHFDLLGGYLCYQVILYMGAVCVYLTLQFKFIWGLFLITQNANFPKEIHFRSTWFTCKAQFAHAITLMSHQHFNISNHPQTSCLLNSLFSIALQQIKHQSVESLGAVSIRKTVLPGMAIPMLKIRRPNGRLIFNMEIAIRR